MSGIYSPPAAVVVVPPPFVFSGAYESLPNAAGFPAGSRALVTSGGWSNFYKSFEITAIGGKWACVAETQIASNPTVVAGVLSAAEQCLKTIGPFPANFFIGRRIVVYGAIGRDSANTAISTFFLRLGTTSSVSDATLIAEDVPTLFPAVTGPLHFGFKAVFQNGSGIDKVAYAGRYFDGLSSHSEDTSNLSLQNVPNSEISFSGGFNFTVANSFITMSVSMANALSSKPIVGFVGVSIQG